MPPPLPSEFNTFQMERFTLFDVETLRKVVKELKPSTCSLDPIPIKSIFNVVSNDLLEIVNDSLQLGIFPCDLKLALVKPLQKNKKVNSDTLRPSNYRPILNLPFLSKILEKIVFNQLSIFLNTHSKLEMFQSGHRDRSCKSRK